MSIWGEYKERHMKEDHEWFSSKEWKFFAKGKDSKYYIRNCWKSDRFLNWYSPLHNDIMIISNQMVETGQFYFVMEDGTLVYGKEVYPPETGMLEKFKMAYNNYLNYLGYVCDWDIYNFEQEGHNEFKTISDKFKEEHPGVVYDLDI